MSDEIRFEISNETEELKGDELRRVNRWTQGT